VWSWCHRRNTGTGVRNSSKGPQVGLIGVGSQEEIVQAPVITPTPGKIRPLNLCLGASNNEGYAPVVGGTTFNVTITWVLETDCSHWASQIHVTSSGAGDLRNVPGSSVDAALGYISGGVFNSTATSLASGCNSTAFGFSTTFSGSFVPNTQTASIIAGMSTSCTASITTEGFTDTVN
jgi:hypothetical protein